MPRGKPKPYRTVLSTDLTAEVLSIPLSEEADQGSDERAQPRTIGERLERALDELEQTVELANEALGDNKMVGIVASTLAKSLKKRGRASICVEANGKVVLCVDYGEEAEDKPKQEPPTAHVQKGKWHSDLPKLGELRALAEELGVDISDLGRQRKAIHERLCEARQTLRHMDEVRVAPMKPKSTPNGPGPSLG